MMMMRVPAQEILPRPLPRPPESSRTPIGYLRLRLLACRNTSTLMRRPLKVIELLASMIG